MSFGISQSQRPTVTNEEEEMESNEFEKVEETSQQQQQQIQIQDDNNNEEEEEDDDDDGPPPGYQTILTVPQPQLPNVSQPQPETEPEPPLTQPPITISTIKTEPSEMKGSFEIAQMVCGSCRRLLRYPPTANQVQCSCCHTVNLVLQAHQVGQVKCGSCTVLLMYPYGASQVRCSSCLFVTEIGAHNHRPPWSVQQGQPISFPNPSQ